MKKLLEFFTILLTLLQLFNVVCFHQNFFYFWSCFSVVKLLSYCYITLHYIEIFNVA